MAKERMAQLAIKGGFPVRDANAPWPSWPIFGEAERAALNGVLESGKWWYGERVKQFEHDFAHFQGAKYCVSTSSGTTAAEICLQAMGIKPGDEVIVPPYTFITTASSVARVGATPVFADVDDTWCLNPDAVKAAITPRTRAIFPVHFGSRMADMDRLNVIAKKYGLIVLEDASHVCGTKWQGKGAGTLGVAGVFSFQMSNSITAGEGGAIITNEETFAENCRSISNCGRNKGPVWYPHSVLVTNARLTEFAGALLVAQLSRIEQQIQIRERNAAILNAALADIEGILIQPGDTRLTRRSYLLYCFRIDPQKFGCSREQFIKAAEAEGLPIGTGYSHPLYEQPLFKSGMLGGRDYNMCSCPVTEDLCFTSGCWFNHNLLLGSEEDMDDIITIFKKIREHVAVLRVEE